MNAFLLQLQRAWEKNDSLVCVGLDPEIERFPPHIAAQPSPIFRFNQAIIDATADLVCAYKQQFAHYAAYEAEDQLERKLYVVRKRIEAEIAAADLGDNFFYIPSLSARTIVYKGLLLAQQIADFYPELSDPEVVS